jgi:hypothetical protein
VENSGRFFPRYGKTSAIISTPWKTAKYLNFRLVAVRGGMGESRR